MTQRPPDDRPDALRLLVHERDSASSAIGGPGVSGRRFVGAGVIGLLLLWGALYVLFSLWRSGVEERIAIGKTEVASVVAGLADLEPPGIDPTEWRQAVAETEAMLAEVVGTGRMDRSRLRSLRSDLSRRVAEAGRSPGSAAEILAGIWDEMARLTRFRDGTERPALIGGPGAPERREEGRE
ncbi:hypothetical protein AB1L88_02475 [Tautonia sp. JC769]|uniref:hypothetical protein n=1 Tax=Tautonia sp. JC769 TaxID=3232135 RepID=UPI00345A680C